MKTHHLAVSIRYTTVSKQHHYLVVGLGVLREVVPEGVGVLEVRLGVPLLRVDKVGELGGVAEEEDGRVVLCRI
jgi:hypothetical protein